MGAKLDEIIKNINRDAKEEIITKGLGAFSYTRVPFTSPRMNYMTYGGLPIGKVIEFFGEEHGGKTTTALDIVANFQNMFPDKDVVFVDAENTFDVEWAKKIGVDVDRLIILQPKSQSAEAIFQIICDVVETGEVGLWVLDSLGVLMSEQEWAKDMDEKTYGGIAMATTKFSKKVEMLMARHKCTGIVINQVREDLNSTWGGFTTPGGKALKHVCSVRIQFSRGKFFDEKGNDLSRNSGEPAGNYVMANAVKNKTAPPTRHVGQYRIRYDIGIDYLADLVDVAIFYGIIDKKGAWYKIIDIETGELLKDNIQGVAKVYEELDNNDALLEKVEQLIELKDKE